VVVKSETSSSSPDELLVVELPEADGTVGVKRLKKHGNKVTICSSNPDFDDIEYSAGEVKIIGKVVTVLRKI
jgi:SOS-response transcriptional repressor LexA